MQCIKELEGVKRAHAKHEANFQRGNVLKNSMESMITKYRELLKEKTAEISQKNLQVSIPTSLIKNL